MTSIEVVFIEGLRVEEQTVRNNDAADEEVGERDETQVLERHRVERAVEKAFEWDEVD